MKGQTVRRSAQRCTASVQVTAGSSPLTDVLDDLMERLAKECKHLVQSTERATLTVRDVEAAVKLLIPPGSP
ncbi:hypothetical protein WJX72_009052 [[Myrmecia] bisecta]|uniref:Uncharacterized protein n=1 Tax=[Myrmecia] bisecta TaxID=41462 RepID=A0AAW1R849_9CHLO